MNEIEHGANYANKRKKNSVGRWAAAGMKNGCFGHVEVDSEQEILALTLNHASQLLDLCD